jgi:glyoxylate reductase
MPRLRACSQVASRWSNGRSSPTTHLINISRGPVVDPEAVTKTLVEKQIAAAALDVTEPEPLPRDHPLLSMPNVMITPNLESATVETHRRMDKLSVDNVLAGLERRPLPARIRS